MIHAAPTYRSTTALACAAKSALPVLRVLGCAGGSATRWVPRVANPAADAATMGDVTGNDVPRVASATGPIIAASTTVSHTNRCAARQISTKRSTATAPTLRIAVSNVA